MYKINLYDQNNPAFCTGSATYFVESLEDFEEHWKPKVGENTLEIYEKSKAGYYGNEFMAGGAEHDMVITDLGATFQEKKQLVKEDFRFELVNGWNWPSEIYAQKCMVKLGLLTFQREDYVVAKYRLEGVCSVNSYTGKRYEFKEISTYGNPILKVDIQSNPQDYVHKEPSGLRDSTAPKETFAQDTVESFVWHIVEKRESMYSIPEEKREDWEKNWYKLSKKQLQNLMIDIPGEAG